VRPRRLGQHFLTDPGILQRIVAALDPAPDDLVLEIGAGKGSLTEQLLAAGLRVIAIEKDRGLASEVGTRNAERGTDRVTVVQGDALDLDWHSLIDPGPSGPRSAFHVPRFKIVGNIPYNITSPLIDKALTPPLPERIVFLVQAEVADRVAAAPGSKPYGALSVGVQAVCRVEKLFTVRAGAFTPAPRVTSALLRLTPRREPIVTPDELAAFRAFVTACFTRRRKQLRNAVMAATGRSAELVLTGLATLGFDRAARPESLTPGDFARLLRWSVRL
jgi:16S rRNA (adenine1518-N6/adenine1519-N6)-dimethyltransferase